MNEEKLRIISQNKGFIAALDQSGGSSSKTLANYGILENQYQNQEEMFNLIHDMRTRIIKSPSFNNKYILGVILFEETMNRKIDDENTVAYLWNKKRMLSFLKMDKGLEEQANGVQLMRPIVNLVSVLDEAKQQGVFGTKMRSVIHEANEEGISRIVDQQFTLAKTIFSKGLIPIIEPEVNINSKEKQKCEEILKQKVMQQLDKLPKDVKVIFKFSLPTIPNFYQELFNYSNVVRIVALSGGYEKNEACQKLAQNNNVIASFSRALLEGLTITDSDELFNQKLQQSIQKIYAASII